MNDRVEEALDDSEKWFPEVDGDLPYFMISLAGEAGEACNAYKKWHRTGSIVLDGDTVAKISAEVVDVLVYAFCIAGALGIDLEEEYNVKRRVNQERFGPAARARADRRAEAVDSAS
jgi:NTP pyrophosphatase (non-canonical NTP hydrolase)